MSEYSLNGRGQGHVSNFYIVDLENSARASRRYTGDIHNSSVVGLFMTPIDNRSDSIESRLSVYVFTARCYASAVLAMGLCPSVSVSVSVCVSLSQAGLLLQRQT